MSTVLAHPKTLQRLALILAAALLLAFGMVRSAHAMHISEGFLPAGMWAAIWFVAVIPFFLWGLRSIARQVNRSPQSKITLGMSGAYAFVLSGLKLPSVTGSCSHPTGVALGAILFGPTTMVVLGTIVLTVPGDHPGARWLDDARRQRLLDGLGRAVRRLRRLPRVPRSGA